MKQTLFIPYKYVFYDHYYICELFIIIITVLKVYIYIIDFLPID